MLKISYNNIKLICSELHKLLINYPQLLSYKIKNCKSDNDLINRREKYLEDIKNLEIIEKELNNIYQENYKIRSNPELFELTIEIKILSGKIEGIKKIINNLSSVITDKLDIKVYQIIFQNPLTLSHYEKELLCLIENLNKLKEKKDVLEKELFIEIELSESTLKSLSKNSKIRTILGISNFTYDDSSDSSSTISSDSDSDMEEQIFTRPKLNLNLNLNKN